MASSESRTDLKRLATRGRSYCAPRCLEQGGVAAFAQPEGAVEHVGRGAARQQQIHQLLSAVAVVTDQCAGRACPYPGGPSLVLVTEQTSI